MGCRWRCCGRRARATSWTASGGARAAPPDGLFAAVDGALRVTAVTAAGREVMLTRAEPPTCLGESAVFDRQPRTHDCLADGDSVVLHVPVAASTSCCRPRRAGGAIWACSSLASCGWPST